MLVWYEGYDRLIDARHRDYKIKRWRRTWKLHLIEAHDPGWRDLYFDLNRAAGSRIALRFAPRVREREN